MPVVLKPQRVTGYLFYSIHYRDTNVFACLAGKEHFVRMNQMNVNQSLAKTMAPAWIFSTAIGKRCSSWNDRLLHPVIILLLILGNGMILHK